MHYLSPRLNEWEMLTLYANDHYFSGEDHGYENYAKQETGLRMTFRRLLQHLSRRGRTGGSMLEIGCGYGYLLDEAHQYFKHRVGTDFSSEAVRVARTRADEVFQGGITAVSNNDRYDLVIATHVIEHVYQPHEFVRSLSDHIRPNGTLLIAAPDMGSFWRKLMGQRWPSFKLPEHVLYFDRQTLSRLLSDCGFENLEIVPYPHAFPLPLIASKFGLELPNFLCRYNFWLPATTIAIMGTKKNA
jgi:SAM-dependent methyltransferase